MKLLFRELLLSVMILSALPIKADLTQELNSLQQHLVVLADSLQKAIKKAPPKPGRDGAGGGKIIKAPVIKTDFQSPKTLNEDSTALAREIKLEFNKMAAVMNNFISTLQDFIMPPSIFDRSAVLDVLVEDINKLVEPERELKKLLKQINGKLNVSSSNDASSIAWFLEKIIENIKLFHTYVDDIYYHNENAWQHITFTYEKAGPTLQREGNVAYHFYNAIIFKGAFEQLNPKNLNGLTEELSIVRDRFVRRSKIKTTGGATGGGQQRIDIPFNLRMSKIPFFDTPTHMTVLNEYIAKIDKHFFDSAKKTMEAISGNLIPAFIGLIAAKDIDKGAIVGKFTELKKQFDNLQDSENGIKAETENMRFVLDAAVGAPEAKSVSEYLDKILNAFLNFGAYIQEVNRFIENNHPQVIVDIEKEGIRLLTTGTAPKLFNEYIMQSYAIKNILAGGELVKVLRNAIGELKQKISVQKVNLSTEEITFDEAVDAYKRLKETIEERINPVSLDFFNRFDKGQPYDESIFNALENVVVSSHGADTFAAQASELKSVLGKVSNVKASDEGQLRDMMDFLDSFIGKIKRVKELMQEDIDYKDKLEIITSSQGFKDIEIITDILNELIYQVTEPLIEGPTEKYKENPWLST